jgi:cellulose synthase/poly-beta-1,6-N-acetylglucosamine synthase-like glycosyltransferase
MILVIITQTFVLLVSLGLSSSIAVYLLATLWKDREDVKTRVRKLDSERNAKTEVLLERVKVPFLFLYVLMIIPISAASYYSFQGFNIDSIYSIIIAFGMTMTFMYNFVNVPLAIYHKKIEGQKRIEQSQYRPLVTIIIPAYNEEKTIQKAIASAIEVDYPRKQILVVDDGSRDNTFGIANVFARKYSTLSSPLTKTGSVGQVYSIQSDANDNENFAELSVLRKENGGKASAINYALRFAKGEFIMIMDADSIIGREAIVETIKHFKDPSVAAVSGNIKVLNRVNLITYCQALEYLIGINLFKRAFDVFGVVMVVPGALGVFRKSILSRSGEFDNNTLTEDFDTTVKVLKTGRAVQGSTYAISYTEAPASLAGLYKQRMRWNRGNMQTLLKHRDVISTPRYGMLHKFGYPLVFLSMVTQSFLGMAVMAFVVLALIHGMWFFVLISFLIFVSLECLLSIIAISIDNEDWKIALVSPLFVIGYKQLNDFFVVKSVLEVLVFRRGRKLQWTSAKSRLTLFSTGF